MAESYTITDTAQEEDTGLMTIVGEVPSAAQTSGDPVTYPAAPVHYIGFLPSRIECWFRGTDGVTIPNVYTWYLGSGTNGVALPTYSYWFLTTGSTGAVTAVTTTAGPVLALVTSGAYEGQYSLTLSAGIHAAEEHYTILIWR